MSANRDGPTLIEVLGVAGSGKSTVTRSLVSAETLEAAPFISARNPSHLVQMVMALTQLFPLVLSNLTHRPRMTWADFKLMAYVTRWDRLLEAPPYARRSLVLDQGPVYALVRLRAKDLGLGSTRAFRRWWSRQLGKWSSRIGSIVWLDAPNDVLISRINTRDQSHWVKGEEVDVSLDFVRRYRELFLEVIERMDVTAGGPVVYRFDTNGSTVREICDLVSRAVESTD